MILFCLGLLAGAILMYIVGEYARPAWLRRKSPTVHSYLQQVERATCTYEKWDDARAYPRSIRLMDIQGNVLIASSETYGDWWCIPLRTRLDHDDRDLARKVFDDVLGFSQVLEALDVEAKRAGEGERSGDQSGRSAHDAPSASVPA